MRRSLRLAGPLAVALAAAAPARAQTYSNLSPIPVSDPTGVGAADPYPSTVVVSGMTGVITDIDVAVLGWGHTFPDDVDIMIVGPTGAATLLVSDVGGGTDITSANLLLDDEAGGTIPDGGPVVSGVYRPSVDASADNFPPPAPPPASALLTNFDGTNPNGTWSLYVVDDTGTGNDVGRLAGGFQLFIATDTTPTPVQFSSPTQVRIYDRWGFGNPNPSTITVSGAGDTIVTVAVTLHGVTHANPDDLEFLLVGPTGAMFSFASDAGGTNALNNVTFTLDGDATIDLPDTGAITNNTSYRPRNYLEANDTFRIPALPPYPSGAPIGSATFATQFTGTNPNGTWSLYVSDDQNNNPGSITGGWSLDFVLTPVELMEFRVE
jgi:subtilisin-like proprotein convertase family protein